MKLITLRLDEEEDNFAYSYLRYKSIGYDQVSEIANRLGARQIPSIYVFNIAGILITRNGLQDIMNYGENTAEVWDQKVKEYLEKQKK